MWPSLTILFSRAVFFIFRISSHIFQLVTRRKRSHIEEERNPIIKIDRSKGRKSRYDCNVKNLNVFGGKEIERESRKTVEIEEFSRHVLKNRWERGD